MTPIEPQVGKFYNSPVALGAGAGAVLTVPIVCVRCKAQHVDIPLDGCVEQVGLRNNKLSSPPLFSLSFSIFDRLLLNEIFITAEG